MNVSNLINRVYMSIYGERGSFSVEEQKMATLGQATQAEIIRDAFNFSVNWEDEALKNPIVFRCINLIAQNVARMKISVDDHAGGATGVDKVFENPNLGSNWYHFIEQIVFDLLVHGVAYVFGYFDDVQMLQAIYCVNPKTITVDRNEFGIKTGYSYKTKKGVTREKIDSNGACKILDISYCAHRNLSGIEGFLSPCKIVGNAVKLDNDIDQHNAIMVKHHPRLGGVLIAENMTPTQREISKETLNAQFKVPGYIPVLTGKDLEMEMYTNTKECDYLEGQRAARQKIIEMGFGIPELLISRGGSGSSTNYGHIRQHFLDDVLKPLAEKICDRLQGWIRNFSKYKNVRLALDSSNIGSGLLDKPNADNLIDVKEKYAEFKTR